MSSGGVSSATEGETSVEPAPNCSDYCELMEVCIVGNAQYGTGLHCKAICELLPVGQAGDESGHNLACRSFYAIQAGEAADVHCINAGPTGGATCGADCDAFCAITLAACTGENEVYPDMLTCTTACTKFPAAPAPYHAGTPNADTYECRVRHLTLAALDAKNHCRHVAPESDVCQ